MLGDEGERAERPLAGSERQCDRAADGDVLKRGGRRRIAPRRLLEQLLRHFPEELGLARAHDAGGEVEVVVDACRPRPRAHLLGPALAFGIRVGDDEPLDLTRLLDEHVDRAPVRELLDGERCEPLERSFEIERGGEEGRGLVEKGEPLAQRLLRLHQVRPLERERRLPCERELERAALRRELLVG